MSLINGNVSNGIKRNWLPLSMAAVLVSAGVWLGTLQATVSVNSKAVATLPQRLNKIEAVVIENRTHLEHLLRDQDSREPAVEVEGD